MSIIQTLYDLELEQTELLHREKVDGEWVAIRQYENYRWLSLGGDMMQSLMDIEHPEELLLPNLNTMLACLDIPNEPINCLNVGAGAGCIDRFLKESKPSISLTSLESNAHVIRLANEFFNMPDGYCIETDIESYIEEGNASFNAILFDIYSEETNPACLYEDNFYKKLSSIMAEQCILAFNLLPESEEDLLGIIKPLNHYVNVLLLHEVPNHNNVIIYAIHDVEATTQSIMDSTQILIEQGIHIDTLSMNC